MDETLFASLLDAARRIHGRKHQIVEDIQRTPLTYGRIVLGSFILGRRLAELTPGEKTIGVLLPNAAGCLVTLFGLHAFGPRAGDAQLLDRHQQHDQLPAGPPR